MNSLPRKVRLSILYQDDSLIAVDKPSGLLVHRGWGRDPVTAVDLVREITGEAVVHPVHRLDRGTSGVLIFARTREAAARLGALFDVGSVKKRYLALVRGVAPDEGVIDHPIPRREDGPRVPARTAFRRLVKASTEPRHVSLVEAYPATGRLHQVRRHLKHISYPVIGDANYGKGELNRAMNQRYGLGRLALHAESLVLSGWDGENDLTISAPLPSDLTGPLGKMGLNLDGVCRTR